MRVEDLINKMQTLQHMSEENKEEFRKVSFKTSLLKHLNFNIIQKTGFFLRIVAFYFLKTYITRINKSFRQATVSSDITSFG